MELCAKDRPIETVESTYSLNEVINLFGES